MKDRKKVIERKTVKRRKRRQGTNKPGLVLEVMPRVPEYVKCQQHQVFQGGHPSKHWRGSSLLNLGDRLVTGPFNPIRPLVNNWGLKCKFQLNLYILKLVQRNLAISNGIGTHFHSHTTNFDFSGMGMKMVMVMGMNWDRGLTLKFDKSHTKKWAVVLPSLAQFSWKTNFRKSVSETFSSLRYIEDKRNMRGFPWPVFYDLHFRKNVSISWHPIGK